MPLHCIGPWLLGANMYNKLQCNTSILVSCTSLIYLHTMLYHSGKLYKNLSSYKLQLLLYSLDMHNNNIINHIHTKYCYNITVCVFSLMPHLPSFKSIGKSFRRTDSSIIYRYCHRTAIILLSCFGSVMCRRISIRHFIEMQQFLLISPCGVSTIY